MINLVDLKNRIKTDAIKLLVKFASFAGFGVIPLLVDLAVSNAFFYTLGWSLTLCGMIGFLSNSLASYIIDLKTIFVLKNHSFSWITLWRYMKTSFLAALIRAGSLSFLAWATAWSGSVIFLLSIGIAGGVRTALSHFYVFRHPDGSIGK